ncbi:MAG: helix-turn-helix transcriptional regulator [Clostridia bacterium]|nr:helix-turn-helix transcriptional regulator [Clostridia bacterium]
MEESFGKTIAALRREKNMTQAELAERMGVTDKAVSKWERDLSYPDTASLPRLAEVLGVTIDELMLANGEAARPEKSELRDVTLLVCKSVALAMGICVTVLSFLGKIEITSAITMLGIGLTALAMTSFVGKHKNN